MNIYKHRVRIQEKVASSGALGQTVVWKPTQIRYALVLLLDAKARAIYQQLRSEISHKVIFRGSVTLSEVKKPIELEVGTDVLLLETGDALLLEDAIPTTLMGNYRFLWKDKTLEPIEPPQELEGQTIVMVREV